MLRFLPCLFSQITNITPLDDGTVVIDFFIVENGRVVETTAAIQTFNLLTIEELEAALKAEVCSKNTG